MRIAYYLKLLLLLVLLVGCDKSPEQLIEVKKQRKTVKVAAIQCYSRMGDLEYNFKLINNLVSKAVEKGAQIIVLPEAAVSGYMNPAKNITWTESKASIEELSVQNVAKTVDSDAIKKYFDLASELQVYLTIPFIEVDKGKFYNSVLLASPQGKLLAHHRKQSLWTHGDSAWCSIGELDAQVVDSEYGKLGLMICYDVHSMPEKLSALKADIVLYSVGWFGPNTEDWYKRRFPKKYVIPNNFSVVAANWSFEKGSEGWEGAGWSNIVYKNGIILNITDRVEGSVIVTADLPLE